VQGVGCRVKSRVFIWCMDRGLFYRNVERFRGGLLGKAHRLLYDSTLGWRVKQKRQEGPGRTPSFVRVKVCLSNTVRRRWAVHSYGRSYLKTDNWEPRFIWTELEQYHRQAHARIAPGRVFTINSRVQ
jgi:hypothetical protein